MVCCVEIRKLPGFASAVRARALSNCFVQSGGRVQSEFQEILGFPKGRIVEYGSENWGTLIDDTSEFLLALAERLKGKDAKGQETVDDYVGIFYADEQGNYRA